jgi:hypothetical protein
MNDLTEVNNKTKFIHITPNKGYEIVNVLAQQFSPKNALVPIEIDGKLFITGGILIKYSYEIICLLKIIPDEKQYDVMRAIRYNTLQFHDVKYFEEN